MARQVSQRFRVFNKQQEAFDPQPRPKWQVRLTMPSISLKLLAAALVSFVTAVLLGPLSTIQAQEEPATTLTSTVPSARPVTVADAIGMTQLADRTYNAKGSSLGSVGVVSPDGRKFVVTLRKGNLQNNTNEYTLLLWRTDEILNVPKPKALLTMASSSNREAIRDVRWLDDNETVSFIGEHPAESSQVFTLNIRTLKLTRLTCHPTSVYSYDFAQASQQLAYIAEQPVRTMFDDDATRNGLVVSSQDLYDLTQGTTGGEGERFPYGDLYVVKEGACGVRTELKVDATQAIEKIAATPYLSPDGRSLVVRAQVNAIPAKWKEYTGPGFSGQLAEEQLINPGQFSTALGEYDLIDVATGETRTLIQSPVGLPRSEVAWSPDSHSVALTGIRLPLDGLTTEEREMRKSTVYAVEVSIPDKELATIATGDFALAGWNQTTNRVCLETRQAQSYGHGNPGTGVQYEKRSGQWTRVAGQCGSILSPVIWQEDMNTPPRLVTTDRNSQKQVVLLDPNPQFAQLRFGHVEEIKWNGADGGEVVAGLYYPIDYQPGHKYPLVIQTHGWFPKRFYIDGPYTSGFAAQPLAGKNIFVVQLELEGKHLGTPKETELAMATFEEVVDYLNRRGLIDPDRVGLTGFSRTCLAVQYTLTHSKYHFAAAAIEDGVDGGYVQYVISLNYPTFAHFDEGINGGIPFGSGMSSWLQRSPSFSLDKVNTPVRILAQNRLSVPSEWEWFVVLSRLHKPVEFVVMQNGSHILQRPWERIVSQQGNVDWFAFWLKDEETGTNDVSREKQYIRWRALRQRYVANQQISESKVR